MSIAGRSQMNGPLYRARGLILAVTLVLAAGATYYLYRKAMAVSGAAGFDFRYLWLAGELWLDGISPYGDQYQVIGAERIAKGHVPISWVYPPNWWGISAVLALFELDRSSHLWNLFNIVLLFGSSILTIRAFIAADPRLGGSGLRAGDLAPFTLPLILLHFCGLAALEASALVLAVGQTSILIYFGMALLAYGMTGRRRWGAVAGLTVIFLKPQIGLIFALAFLIWNREARRVLLWALIVSLLLALPAFVSDPMVPLSFLHALGGYDAFADANRPQAMTGIRLAVWEGMTWDIGNIRAGLIAAAAGLAYALAARRGADVPEHDWWLVAVLVALTAAIAPLHYYDFVIVGLLVPAVLCARPVLMLAGLIGGALILRADQLGKITGLYDPEVAIFEGSILSTIGAALILIAVLAAAFRARLAAP